MDSDSQPILEIAGHLLDQSRQVFLGWKLVVGSINADRLERLCILNEAVPLESGLGEFPPVVVTLLVVDLPRPTEYFQLDVPTKMLLVARR